jgi:hypothetical protein
MSLAADDASYRDPRGWSQNCISRGPSVSCSTKQAICFNPDETMIGGSRIYGAGASCILNPVGESGVAHRLISFPDLQIPIQPSTRRQTARQSGPFRLAVHTLTHHVIEAHLSNSDEGF